jgi:hypothetical protein
VQQEEQDILIAALRGMEVISQQVNLLLDGYEYLISTIGELDHSLFFQRQVKDGSVSMASISEQMLLIKKMVISVNDGNPIKGNRPFKNEVLTELTLHMDMIRNLLQDYEIHPEGYSAVKIATALLNIRQCINRY